MERAEPVRTEVPAPALARREVVGFDRVLLVALGGLSILALAWFVLHAARAIVFPFPLDYGEGPLLDQARRIAHGENVWRPSLDDYPFTIANYPPLFPLLLAPIASAGKLAYSLGRVLTVAAAGVCAWHVWGIVRANGGARRHALAAVALFLASPCVVFWSTLVRIDFVALAFSLGAVHLVAKRPDARAAPYVAAGLVLLAALTRQSHLLAAPLAIVGAFASKELRRAVVFVGALAGGVVASVLALQAATHGGFLFNVVTANANKYDVGLLQWFAGELATTSAALLLVGFGQALLGARDRGLRLVSLYVLGGALSALTIGKVGSHVNYFLELVAAASIACGVLLARASAWRARAAGALLAAQLVAFLGFAVLRPENMEEKLRMRPDFERLSAVIGAEPREILADETMGLLPLSGRPILLQPFEMTQLARQGIWDQRRVVDDLKAKRFGLVLINDTPATPESWVRVRWTDEMLGAVHEAYAPEGALANATLYRPKP